MEAAADRFLASHGGFGKRQGFYTDSDLRKQSHGIKSFEDLAEAVPDVTSAPNESLARLVHCLRKVQFSDTEHNVVYAMIELYSGPRRPVFRAVARRAKCSTSEAYACWGSAAKKILDWAEAHPTEIDARREMIELLIEVFGSYAVRLAGICW
jgi:hypothetical protein